jgi:CRISPR/Cas system CSM-associated protein Csm4 (group 5 of RAMP superfamily)
MARLTPEEKQAQKEAKAAAKYEAAKRDGEILKAKMALSKAADLFAEGQIDDESFIHAASEFLKSVRPASIPATSTAPVECPL